MSDQEMRDTLRQMLADWNRLTPEQQAALAALEVEERRPGRFVARELDGRERSMRGLWVAVRERFGFAEGIVRRRDGSVERVLFETFGWRVLSEEETAARGAYERRVAGSVLERLAGV